MFPYALSISLIECDPGVTIPWNAQLSSLHLTSEITSSPPLQGLKGVLDGLVPSWEVVVVDGGSTDGTVELARRRGASVIFQTEPGYGEALKAGFEAARDDPHATQTNYPQQNPLKLCPLAGAGVWRGTR